MLERQVLGDHTGYVLEPVATNYETRSGDIAAIEVKAGASLDARDWRAIAKLRDRSPARFRAGIVIHTGRQTIPLGDRLWAVPISGLWT